MRSTIALMLLCATLVRAETVGGPQGGRLLDNDPPRAEFFVNAERRVEVRFYDAGLNVVAPGEQAVTVLADAPSGKVTWDLVREGDALVSAAALPEGDGYTIVVQIRATPGAKPRNFRIVYHAALCGECRRAEYACSCDHAGEDSGHAH